MQQRGRPADLHTRDRSEGRLDDREVVLVLSIQALLRVEGSTALLLVLL